MFISMETGELFQELSQVCFTPRGKGGKVVVDYAGRMDLV